MSNWPQLLGAYTELADALREQRDVREPWRRFADAANVSRSNPPYHLRPLLRVLQRTKLAPERIRLLEHGFGSAKSLLYLLALGYRGIHGVDIETDCSGWNKLLREIFGISEPRFFSYDGAKLPFPDESFDLIFSQQVIEHVSTDMLEDYCAEEARVLCPGGLAYHQIPHRLVPYDSHTRTWFIHYAARPLALKLYALMKRDVSFVRNHLFLRSRKTYAAIFAKYLGPCEDLTAERLIRDRVEGYYDGPAGLRRVLSRLFASSAAGPLFAGLARHFMMADILVTKRAAITAAASAS